MRSWTLAVALLLALCATRARAEEPAKDQAELTAEALFVDGVALAKKDRCAEAIDKFEESQRLSPASGTALNLAYCQASLGRIASAWLTYRKAIALARAQHKPEHEQLARSEAERLAPELPQVTVIVPSARAAALAVELDGQPLAAETWSVPVPIDPGSHRVAVRVAGTVTWHTDLSVKRGEHATLNVPADAVKEQPAPTRAPTERPVPQAERGGNTRRTWTLVLGGAGTAVLVVGGALFASARIAYDGVGSHCDATGCDESGYATRRAAQQRGRASYFVMGGGAVLLGASATLWLTRGSDATSVRASVEPTAWTLSLERQF